MTILLVIATVLLLLTIDWLVRRSREKKVQSLAGPKQARGLTVRLPAGIFFSPSHTWLNLLPSGSVRLGVDDFITGLLEKPRVTLLRQRGESVNTGDPLMRLESNGNTLTVRSPVDAEIVTVNGTLQDNPGFLGEKLFSEGWAYLIAPARISDLKKMYIGGEARAWIGNELQRLKDLLAIPSEGTTQPGFIQEGGPPVSGVLSRMDESVWRRLDESFLNI